MSRSQSRVAKHAELLARWAVDIEAGDMVTIWAADSAKELVDALHAEIGKRRAEPVTVTASLDTTIGPFGSHIAKFLANHEGEFETPHHLRALMCETDARIVSQQGQQTRPRQPSVSGGTERPH